MQCADEERSLYIYMTAKTKDQVGRAMEYLGYNRESFKFLNRDTEGAHAFLGKEINVRCEHEEYEGSVQERWSLCTSAEIKPLHEMRVMELDSMFGKSGSNGPKIPKNTKAKPVEKSSDIPF